MANSRREVAQSALAFEGLAASGMSAPELQVRKPAVEGIGRLGMYNFLQVGILINTVFELGWLGPPGEAAKSGG